MRLIIVFIFFSSIQASGQAINWALCFGGTGVDGVYRSIKTSDNGSLIVGSTSSNDGDVSGNHLFYNTSTNMYEPSVDVWLIKLDSTGNLQWEKCYGGSGYDVGTSLVETTDGYAVVAASTSSDGDITFTHGGDYWVFKIDYSGNINWQKCYGGYGDDEPYTILKTPDNGFFISGQSLSPDGGDVLGHHGISASDLWVIKIDSVGNLLWQKCLGGSQSEFYGFSNIDAAGNIYVTGKTGSSDGDVTCTDPNKEAWVVKLDGNGNILWDKCYGGTGQDGLSGIKFYGDTLFLSGASRSNDFDLPANYGIFDAWIILADTSGNIIWSKNYGGSSSDGCPQVELDKSHNFIYALCGSSSNDIDVSNNHGYNDVWMIKLDLAGNLLWQHCYGGNNGEAASSFFQRDNSTIQFSGFTNTNNNGDVTGYHDDSLSQGFNDYWIVSIDLPTGLNEAGDEINNISIYPNPFKDKLTFNFNELPAKRTTLTIYNNLGEPVAFKKFNAANILYYTWDLGAIPMGLYMVELQTDKGVKRCKVIKQ